MKKLLLVISILLTHYANSQTSVYHPFPDSNAVWREESGVNNSLYIYIWNEELFINGDTTIGAYNYHKIYKSGIYKELEIPAFTLDSTHYYYDNYAGFIRQDSNKKVFTYNPSSNQDELLYDFNLQVGDTIPVTFNHQSSVDTITISSIDSVFDGTNYRKHFFLRSNLSGTNYTSIIEGIGCKYGLFTSLTRAAEGGGILHCFTQNDSIKFTDSSMYACDWISNTEEHQKKEYSTTIFPNPFLTSATLKIANFDFQSLVLKIFDTMGRCKQEQIIHSPEITIYKNNLSSGIYYYQITDTKDHLTNGKFAIE